MRRSAQRLTSAPTLRPVREPKPLWKSLVCFAALVLATALGACGGGDDGGDDETGIDVAQRSVPIRCTPQPDAPKQLRVRAKWSRDEIRSLTITKERRDADASTNQQSKATAVVRVLRAGRRGSLLRWSSGDVALPASGAGITEEQLQRLKRAAGEFQVVYSTDRAGTFEKVSNVPALRAQVRRTLGVLDRLGGDDPKLSEAIAASRELVLSDAFIRSALVKEIVGMHAAYGLKLTAGRARTLPYELANPFGGEALPARARIKLVDAQDAAGCALIQIEVTPDSDAVTDAIVRGQRASGASAPSAADLAGFSIRNTLRYSYDPGSGWIVRADLRQSIKAGNRSRTDRTVISSR